MSRTLIVCVCFCRLRSSLLIVSVLTDGYTVIVRDCVVDAGGTNSETEIGRESHCWIVSEIKFDNKKMKGCSVACLVDGCNGAPATPAAGVRQAYSLLVSSVVTSAAYWFY